MNVNTVIIGGRLTRNAACSVTKTGVAVAEFDIAHNEYRGGENIPHYFKISAFGKTAETIEKLCAKGCRIIIDGRLQYNAWEDKNGKKQSTINIIANRVFLVDFAERTEDGNNIQNVESDNIPF